MKTFIVFAGGLMVGLGCVLTIWLALRNGHPTAYAAAVPIVGIVLFLGIAFLGHYTLPETSTAAIRSGIAAGLFGAYLTVLGFSAIKTNLFQPNLVKHLTYVVGAVIAFYFGSATASDHIRAKKKDEGGDPG